MNSQTNIFRQLFDRDSSTFTYLLGDLSTAQAILIDPVAGHESMYLQLLSEMGLSLSYALDTHVHADHVTALGTLRELTACQSMMGAQSEVGCVSATFAEGDQVCVGNIALDVLYTPGHTSDSYCFYWQSSEGARVFTGDTLLIRGTGRTDFQNGDALQQYQSLQRLISLPDETLVYPGHDYKGWSVSTIGEERRFNPRLQVNNQREYQELMANLQLPNPAQMDIAIPANRRCGHRPD